MTADRIDALADALVEAGLGHAYGVTGSGPSLELITALTDRDVPYHATRHEAAAALMAGAVSATSDSLGASVTIKGPGLANAMPGIVSNHLEGRVAVHVSEAYGPGDDPHRMHKRVDQQALVGSPVRSQATLQDVDRLDHLLATARTEVPGPLHLELHEGPAPEPDDRSPPDRRGVDDIPGLLASANRPLVIAGSLATRRRWGDRLAELEVPVLTTVAAKGLVPEGEPPSGGIYTGVDDELAPCTPLLKEADLVVGLGLRAQEVITPTSTQAPIVVLDEISTRGIDGFEPKVHALSDDPATYGHLLGQLDDTSWGLDAAEAARSRMLDHLLDDPWLPAACFATLNEWSRDHALVLDTGYFCTVGEHVWTAGPERPYMGSDNGRYMGTAIPSALGLAHATDGLPVVACVGDGGIGMYTTELCMAVEEELPLCVVLMSDGRYGSVATSHAIEDPYDAAFTFPTTDWAPSLDALGVPVRKVDDRDDFRGIIHAWDGDGPLFIQTRFDPDRYARMTERIR